jgi:hypothetical protein
VRPPARDTRDDRGGVWIVTGLVLGGLVYLGVVVMAAAGFTVVVPLVVVPPVLVGVIGANSLLGGGRTDSRTAGRSGDRHRSPSPSNGPDPTVASGGVGSAGPGAGPADPGP